MENYDASGTINPLNRIVEIEGNKSPYLDTLSKLNFQLGYYESSFKTGLLRLESYPNDFLLHEFLAICAYKINDLKNGAYHYSKAFQLTKGSLYAFHCSKIHNEMESYNEALIYIKYAEKELISEDYQFKVYYSSKDKGRIEVVIASAIFNLKGLIYFNLNQFKSALTSFKMALKVEPTFVIAKENVRLLNTILKSKN